MSGGESFTAAPCSMDSSNWKASSILRAKPKPFKSVQYDTVSTPQPFGFDISSNILSVKPNPSPSLSPNPPSLPDPPPHPPPPPCQTSPKPPNPNPSLWKTFPFDSTSHVGLDLRVLFVIVLQIQISNVEEVVKSLREEMRCRGTKGRKGKGLSERLEWLMPSPPREVMVAAMKDFVIVSIGDELNSV